MSGTLRARLSSSRAAGWCGVASPRTGNAAALAEISAPVVRQRWWVLGILSLLMGFGAISTDLYLPAMPAMGRSLDASAGTVEWTVSGYLIGFSLGQLLWGPVSDRHGRRLPVAIGLVLFVIGSAGCALSGSVSTIIAWRIVQAVGASAGVALPRAMVRDLYEGHRAAQMLSTLITVMAIAPLLGPIVGGQILAFAGWRAIFLDAGGCRPLDSDGVVDAARDAAGRAAQRRARSHARCFAMASCWADGGC